MKLISSPASPYVRKVHVVLHETGLLDRVEVVGVKTTPLATAPEAAGANPLGKIPALLRDDAPALYDSRVITRYLDDQAGSTLYPQARIWDVLTLEATADGILDAAVGIMYERRFRAEENVSEPWVEAQWAKVARALDAVNDRWISHLEGPLTMGQIAMGCALGYLDFRHDVRQWRKDRGALDDWYAIFSQRPAMIATAPHD